MPDNTSENVDQKEADVPDMGGPSAANPEPEHKNPVEELQTQISHRDKRNKYVLHTLQALGGTGLVVSAIFEGNIGRLATGAANAARNVWQLTTLFNTKSRKSERKNEVVMNGVSAGTNIPQLLTSASLHETGAAASAVAAYTLRATRYKFSRRMAKYRASLPPTGHTAISILIKSTNKVLRFGPSVLLFNRALAQTMDGYVRKDWAAFGSGVAFTLGAIFMAVSDRKRGQDAKQLKEEKKELKREKQLEAKTGEKPIKVDVPSQDKDGCIGDDCPEPPTTGPDNDPLTPPEGDPDDAPDVAHPLVQPATARDNRPKPPKM